MKRCFFFLFVLLGLNVAGQSLSNTELEKLLRLNISEAQDFLSDKGFDFLGGVEKGKMFEDTRNLTFGQQKPLKLAVVVTYNKQQELPVLISYFCTAAELKARKAAFVSKGFTYKNSFTSEKTVKTFFEKLGSNYSLAFGSSYDMEKKIGSYSVQLLKK